MATSTLVTSSLRGGGTSAAASELEVAQMLREFLTRELFGPAAKMLGTNRCGASGTVHQRTSVVGNGLACARGRRYGFAEARR
jgi:hypothetical protein